VSNDTCLRQADERLEQHQAVCWKRAAIAESEMICIKRPIFLEIDLVKRPGQSISAQCIDNLERQLILGLELKN
jgi:hypothetical protein